MNKMTLSGESGQCTVWRNPNSFTLPKKDKYASNINTYGGTAYFSWGTFTAGQKIKLEWDWYDSTSFDTLQTLLENDEQIVWDPQTGITYNVEMMKLNGKYVESSLVDAPWRRSVVLELLIQSEV
jgi:hypothetical protein